MKPRVRWRQLRLGVWMIKARGCEWGLTEKLVRNELFLYRLVAPFPSWLAV